MSETNRIDWELFEFVIALNVTTNETYTASVLDALDLNYFTNKDIRNYVGVVLEYFKQHSKLPNSTELKIHLGTEELKQSYRNIAPRLKQLDTTYFPEELILNTERFFKERAIYNAIHQTVTKYSQKNSMIDSQETYKLFEDACNISLVDNLGHDYFYQIDKHIEDLHITEKYISTGYAWLNKILNGGFQQSGRALYIFTGATNSGKSVVLGNLATNIIKQGLCVPIISLEMPESLYAKRISSQLSRIPFNKLKQESDMLKNYLNNFKTKNPNARMFIKEYPPKGVTSNHIKAYIKKLIMKERIKVDAIIIDYINLLKPVTDKSTMYENIKSIAEDIRALSYIFTCPIITATQLNRDGLNTANPGMDATSESMGLAHTADFMASIWSTEAEKSLVY